jgi:hypothetical protein
MIILTGKKSMKNITIDKLQHEIYEVRCLAAVLFNALSGNKGDQEADEVELQEEYTDGVLMLVAEMDDRLAAIFQELEDTKDAGDKAKIVAILQEVNKSMMPVPSNGNGQHIGAMA